MNHGLPIESDLTVSPYPRLLPTITLPLLVLLTIGVVGFGLPAHGQFLDPFGLFSESDSPATNTTTEDSPTDEFLDALLESTVNDSVYSTDELDNSNDTLESDITSIPPVRHENNRALFSVMDKITGRTTQFEVFVDETIEFGRLRITPRVCYSRPVTVSPKTSTFVEVDEILLDGDQTSLRRIFTGWMFAESPGLNAVDHAVNDVWLTGCAGEYVSPTASDFPLPPGAPPLRTTPPPLPADARERFDSFSENITDEELLSTDTESNDL